MDFVRLIIIEGGIMRNSISLSVGDSFHLKTGKDYIIYAGMPSENVYSIVQKKCMGLSGIHGIFFIPRAGQA